MYDAAPLIAVIASHASESGLFNNVLSHELISPPTNGLTAAVWVQRIDPLPTASGLSSTTGRLLFNVRLYYNSSQGSDSLEAEMINAATALMGAYSGDFEFGGLIRDIDLLGQYGEGLTAEAGYIEFSDSLVRVMTLTVPLVVNDLWEQVE